MDGIFESWLVETAAEAHALSDASDILELHQLASNRFVARFACRTLVCDPGGEPQEVWGVQLGFFLDAQYLRQVDPQSLITILQPTRIWHPNGLGPFLCIGVVAPGTPLTQLLYRAYDVLAYANFTVNEFDSLNIHACAWARRNQDLFPLERQPLKRRNSTGAGFEMQVV